MTVRFCPQCGTQSVPQANFCAACGEALPGAGKGMSRRGDTSVSTSWRPLAPGLVVLSLYLVVGTGLWFFVLRSQPFPSVTASAGGRQASTGGSALPQDHPPVSLPDEVKKRIAELVDKANAAPQDVPLAIERLTPMREISLPLLRERLANTPAHSSERLHVAFALASFGDVEDEFLLERTVTMPASEARNGSS